MGLDRIASGIILQGISSLSNITRMKGFSVNPLPFLRSDENRGVTLWRTQASKGNVRILRGEGWTDEAGWPRNGVDVFEGNVDHPSIFKVKEKMFLPITLV